MKHEPKKPRPPRDPYDKGVHYDMGLKAAIGMNRSHPKRKPGPLSKKK